MDVQTVLGRSSLFKGYQFPNAIVRGGAERNAVTPIQGSAADIIKIAMINIHKNCFRKLEKQNAAQVHDELCLTFNCRTNEGR
jgi:DNA polymerase-1